ncbi:MAG: hypothetical protein MJ117_10400 [Lachnospiraceae bacterium]|nr:hypothetical protein [Lachnospiraceae bacterium]
MAKFLRFLFNLLLMLYIVAALALFVPPLVGVATAVTLEDTEGNQELATVNYAWRTPLKELQPGDEILVTEENSVYVYPVGSVDTEKAVVNAADPDKTEIPVRTFVYKLVLTVPYLGYIAILLQTQEGMIILGAVAATLLVLCILTSIWVRRRKIKRMKEDEENLIDEEDNQFFEALASQKRESDQRAEAEYRERQEVLKETTVIDPKKLSLDEEYEELPPAEKAQEIPVKEELLEDLDEEDPQTGAEVINSSVAEEDELLVDEKEADKTLQKASEEKKEDAAADMGMEVERAVSTGNIPGVQAALEAALDTQQIQRHVRRAEVVREPEVEPEALPADEIELAMPVYTVDEYLEKAYQNGEDPVVKKDELTGVTYIDFSECL